jgi:hypothetical protein
MISPDRDPCGRLPSYSIYRLHQFQCVRFNPVLVPTIPEECVGPDTMGKARRQRSERAAIRYRLIFSAQVR